MSASARGAREAALGAPGDTVSVAIEVDGLLQRFGRTVPDSLALLERIARLQESEAGGRLDVSLVRFGPGDERDLVADIAALGAATLCRQACFRVRTMATAGDLEGAGSRTMLLAGGAQSALEALDRGIPAYLVSDRRLRDHRQLSIFEVERVIAETLRLAVPRPMSDESRRGCLLAMEAGTPQNVRQLGASLLREDPRADWATLGRQLVLYVESAAASARLVGDGAAMIAPAVGLQDIGVRRLPTAADTPADALLTSAGWALCRCGEQAAGWDRIRRARLGAHDMAFAAPARLLPSLAEARPTIEEVAMRWNANPDSVAAPAALLSQARSFEDGIRASLGLPFADDASERILLIAEKAGEGPGRRAAASLARELRRRGERGAIFLCLRDEPEFDRYESLLWAQEKSRVQGFIVLGAAEALNVRPEEVSAPPSPLRLRVDLPADGDGGALEVAANRILAILAD